MLVHLGCGSKYFEGWLNVDFYPLEQDNTHRGNKIEPDLWADLRRPEIFLEKECASLVFSSHVLEHLYCHEGVAFLSDYFNYIKPGGYMIIETPDLDRVCAFHLFRNLLPTVRNKFSRNKARIEELKSKLSLSSKLDVRAYLEYTRLISNKFSTQFYGAHWEINDISYPYHKFVWTRKSLSSLSVYLGYNIDLSTSATSSHCPLRDMAIILRKPGILDPDDRDVTCSIIDSFYGNSWKRFYRKCYGVLSLFN